MRENFNNFGICLKKHVPRFAGLGIGICGLIVTFEPELLPAFPACAGIAAVNLGGLAVGGCVLHFELDTAASIAACGKACFENR